MATEDLLKDLNNKIDTCKSDLSATLNEKGVSSTTGDTLSLMIDKVDKIQSIDWSKVGYTTAPEPFVNGCNEGINTKETWDESKTNLDYHFLNNRDLMFMPVVSFSNVTSMVGCFQDCTKLCELPKLDLKNVKSLSHCFENCSAIKKIEVTTTANCTDFSYAFYNCRYLEQEPRLLWVNNAVSTENMFDGCENLRKIEQPLYCGKSVDTSMMFAHCNELQLIKEIDVASSQDIHHMFHNCFNLRYLYINNLGKVEKLNPQFLEELNLSYTKWGVDGDGIVGAKQSVLDTFNGAFDRKAAGYPTLKIIISKETSAVITPEEKSAFENKGYLLTII